MREATCPKGHSYSSLQVRRHWNLIEKIRPDYSDLLSKCGHFYSIETLEAFPREPCKIQKQFYT